MAKKHDDETVLWCWYEWDLIFMVWLVHISLFRSVTPLLTSAHAKWSKRSGFWKKSGVQRLRSGPNALQRYEDFVTFNVWRTVDFAFPMAFFHGKSFSGWQLVPRLSQALQSFRMQTTAELSHWDLLPVSCLGPLLVYDVFDSPKHYLNFHESVVQMTPAE